LAPTVPTYVPDELTAGQTWKFTLSYGDFPAGDGWSLAVYFRGAGTLDATVANSRIAADGDSHAVTIAAADTGVAAGLYEWLAEATHASEGTYTADSGSVRVRAKLSAAVAGDRQAHAEVMLAAYEAEIQARLTGAGTSHEAHTILGRSISLVPLEQLEAGRRKYAAEVLALRYKGRLPSVGVHF
jgi:hypothetical protein